MSGELPSHCGTEGEGSSVGTGAWELAYPGPCVCKCSFTHTVHSEAESCHLSPLVHSDLSQAQLGTSRRCPDHHYSLALECASPFLERLRPGGLVQVR